MANERTLNVYMDGIPVGTLDMSNAGSLSFSSFEDYAATDGATPLSLSMPLSPRSFGNRVVLPFLQGLLPDNPLALESMARTYHVSAASPFALLEYVGHDVAGALQMVRPGDDAEDAVADRTRIAPISDDELSLMLRNAIDVYDNGSPVRGTQRMSLAGAQAKVGVAALPGGGWGIPSRGVPTTHIFKPQLAAQSTFPDSDVVEMFCQNVVREAGLPSAKTDLWHSPDGSVRAIVSERYDRAMNIDGTYRRLHQEDLCQAMSVPPAKKYQRNDSGPGLGQIGQLFATRMDFQSADKVSKAFLTALTANAALLNTDAHAKNYSLMLHGDSVALAPMYDVLSIAAFLTPDEHPLFPMRIGKTFDLEQVFPETLVKEARRLNINADAAADIVDRTLERLSHALDATAERMSGLDRDGIITRTISGIRNHSALMKALSSR